MADIQTALRARAAELLTNGEVTMVIGWENGRFENQTTPFFATTAAEAERLVFNDYCVNTVAKYAFKEFKIAAPDAKLAVCVRGCDSRGINRMIRDNQLDRQRVYLLGVPCGGMHDRSGQLLEKCKNCTVKNPVIYDELLGEAVEESQPDRFEVVRRFEEMDREKRAEYFNEVFSRCIRCYACREVCPVCTCRECFVDQHDVGWQGKQNNPNENRFYNLTRVFHVADRCIECGECERACPMNLPLMAFNRKMVKDLDDLFQAGEAGLDAAGSNAFGTYNLSDAEEFM
ncbi:MAG: 4Fe-4S binding protein [Actinomycetia bacterium]|nr:4Fe-4S binding protein [Actinomycetes bacterium]